MSEVTFRGTIDNRKRIQVPFRIENPGIGDNVLVTLKKIPKPEKTPILPPTKEKISVEE